MHPKIKYSIAVSFFILVIITGMLFAQNTNTTKTKGVGNKTTNVKDSKPTDTPTVPDTNKTKKRVIVVLNFDDASLSSQYQKREMGRQLAILLSNEFATKGDFEVIERANIDKVIAEQDTSYDSRRDPKLAAQISKVWSATSVVIGSVTEYTVTTKRVSVLGIGKITTTAKVGLAVRLVNVNTGAVQDSVTVTGTKDSTETINPYSVSTTDKDEEFKTSLLTEAANKAVADSVKKLEKLIDKSETGDSGVVSTTPASSLDKPKEEKKGGFGLSNPFKKKPKEEKTVSQPAAQTTTLAATTPIVTATPGKIIAVTPNKLILKGTFANAKAGTKLVVYRVIKEHLDPDNPKIVAFVETEEVATIEIIEIQPSGISAKVITGKEVKSGDLVKMP